jgi:hypothetical protein
MYWGIFILIFMILEALLAEYSFYFIKVVSENNVRQLKFMYQFHEKNNLESYTYLNYLKAKALFEKQNIITSILHCSGKDNRGQTFYDEDFCAYDAYASVLFGIEASYYYNKGYHLDVACLEKAPVFFPTAKCFLADRALFLASLGSVVDANKIYCLYSYPPAKTPLTNLEDYSVFTMLFNPSNPYSSYIQQDENNVVILNYQYFMENFQPYQLLKTIKPVSDSNFICKRAGIYIYKIGKKEVMTYFIPLQYY